MMSRIRLAEARGLLTGARASRVQVDSLEIIILRQVSEENVSRRKAHESRKDQMGLALLTHGQDKLESLFPHWFADAPEVSSFDAIETESDDHSVGSDWQSSEETPSKSDIEDIMALMGNTGGMSLSDVPPGEWV